MPRAQSKIMSQADKKAKLDDLRKNQADAMADLKAEKMMLTECKKTASAANKAVKGAQSAVNKQQKIVDKAKKAVANCRAA